MIDFSKFGPRRELKDVLKFDKYILFGAGEASNEVCSYLESNNKKIIAFSDNNQKLIGQTKNNIPIISPSAISSLLSSNVAIIISSSNQYIIANQLMEDLGIKLDRIFPYLTEMFSAHYDGDLLFKNSGKISELIDLLSDQESKDYIKRILEFRWTLNPRCLVPNPKLKSFYDYNEDILGPKPDQVVVDCGAYNGDTAQLYLQRTDNRCVIYAIEAFPTNFKVLSQWVKDNNLQNKVIPINIAVGEKNGTISFSSEKDLLDPRASIISKRGADSALKFKVETLDEIFSRRYNTPVNFIKMDIEGAEEKAILGAENLIKKYKPGLAIASYHLPAHLWELPLLLSKMNSNYRIFAGHHPKCVYETEYYLANKE